VLAPSVTLLLKEYKTVVLGDWDFTGKLGISASLQKQKPGVSNKMNLCSY